MKKTIIPRLRRTAYLSGLIGAMVFLGATVPASAQIGDPELGERVWREISNCADCHGWAGDGVPDIPQEQGADLRESLLTPEFAFEVIRCGRPGTAMPAFRRNTWSEIIPCYGMTEPMAPGMQPERSESPLSDRFIEALVAFVFQDFVGQGPVTHEYCVGVFGDDSLRCNRYPAAAEVGVDAGDEPAPAEPAEPAPAEPAEAAPMPRPDHDG